MQHLTQYFTLFEKIYCTRVFFHLFCPDCHLFYRYKCRICGLASMGKRGPATSRKTLCKIRIFFTHQGKIPKKQEGKK